MAERPFLNKKKYLRYEPGPRLWEKLTKIKELTDLLLNKEQSIRKTRDFFYLSCPTGKEQSLINENNAKKDSYRFCQLLKIQSAKSNSCKSLLISVLQYVHLKSFMFDLQTL